MPPPSFRSPTGCAPLAIGMPVTSVHFLGDSAAFVGAEENVALVDAGGEISRVAVHGGGILCAASDGNAHRHGRR